ncbi:MAG: hypothetical protein JXR53_00215 [Bacteroidales bacterium]|nr:hypothetical protein [Bacteroidales bacterium]
MNKTYIIILVVSVTFIMCGRINNTKSINENMISYYDKQISHRIERISSFIKEDSTPYYLAIEINNKVKEIKKSLNKGEASDSKINSLFEYIDNNNLGKSSACDLLIEAILQEKNLGLRSLFLLEYENYILLDLNERQISELFIFDYIRIVVIPDRETINYGETYRNRIFIVSSNYDSLAFYPIINNDTLGFADNKNKDCFEYSASEYSKGINNIDGEMKFISNKRDGEMSIPFSFSFTVN